MTVELVEAIERISGPTDPSPRRGLIKWIVVACVLATTGLALASCGSGSPTSTTTTTAATPTITEHFTKLPCNHNNTLGLEGCAEGQLLSADRRIDKEVKLLFSLVPKAQQKSLTSSEKVFLTYRKSTCHASAMCIEEERSRRLSTRSVKCVSMKCRARLSTCISDWPTKGLAALSRGPNQPRLGAFEVSE